MRWNPIFSPLLADPETSAIFSSEAETGRWLAFQIALVRAQGFDPSPLQSFTPDIAALALGALKDGVPIPAFVAALKSHAPGLAQPIHLYATSQDVTDTSLMMALKAANSLFLHRIQAVLAGLRDLDAAHGAKPLMARTRMQAAQPMTVGDRMGRWIVALQDAGERLEALRPGLEVLQYGGAIGTQPGSVFADALAQALGLRPVPPWHTNRARLADYAAWLSLVTGVLGKFGQDIALMAELGEVRLQGGASSAMLHKNNPVLAEVLVAIARKTASDLSAMHQALVAEQERSGASMTLEWLTLPDMVVSAGTALSHARALAESITSLGS